MEMVFSGVWVDTMTDELKSCPFCGSVAEVHYQPFDCAPDMYRVDCFSCGAGVELYDTEEQAITAWNTRHESDMLPQWIKNCLFDKMDDLRDIVDSPFVVPQIKGAAKAQIDMIEWMLTLRKPEEK